VRQHHVLLVEEGDKKTCTEHVNLAIEDYKPGREGDILLKRDSPLTNNNNSPHCLSVTRESNMVLAHKS
jgi:hypothetical protein